MCYIKEKEGGFVFNDIIQAIGSYGFPIVVAVAVLCWCAWYISDNQKQHTDQIEKLNEQHKAEMAEITTAVNNNTLVLQRLIDLLQKDAEVKDE